MLFFSQSKLACRLFNDFGNSLSMTLLFLASGGCTEVELSMRDLSGGGGGGKLPALEDILGGGGGGSRPLLAFVPCPDTLISRCLPFVKPGGGGGGSEFFPKPGGGGGGGRPLILRYVLMARQAELLYAMPNLRY